MDLSVRYPILNFSWSCGKRWHFSRDAEFWECLSGEVEVSLDVLANDWLLVMASDVVPLDPVAVKVVEDGHTSLVISGRILNLLPVVGLGLRRTGSSSLGPVVEPSSVCWVHPSLVGGPKPSVDVFGQEVLAVTALKVAHSSGRPEVLGVWMHKTLDEIVFSLSFNGDQVHASLPAVVPGVEPVPICGLQPVIITLPRHPVKVVAKPDIALSVHSVLAQLSVGETEESLVCVLVPSTVPGVDLVFAGGDGLLRAADTARRRRIVIGVNLVLRQKIWHFHLGQVKVLHGVVGHVLDLVHTLAHVSIWRHLPYLFLSLPKGWILIFVISSPQNHLHRALKL